MTRRDAQVNAFLADLGKTIREERKGKGLHQEQLSQRCGMGVHAVGEIERGAIDVSVSRLWRIAEGLGLKLSELFARFEAATGTESHTEARRQRTLAKMGAIAAKDLHAVETLVDALAEKQRRRS